MAPTDPPKPARERLSGGDCQPAARPIVRPGHRPARQDRSARCPHAGTVRQQPGTQRQAASVPAIEDLKELVQARDSAVGEQTALQNQLASAATTFLRRQLKRRLGRIATDIAALAREILRQIKADEGLARRYAILVSIPGFGPIVAATLLAQLAELGECSDKQIAMLAGLAPVADDSGKRNGQRIIRSGRPAARRVLYLSALSATRCHAAMKDFYHRLTAAGKPPKLALVAVARKLLVLANALLSNDRVWQPLPPNHA